MDALPISSQRLTSLLKLSEPDIINTVSEIDIDANLHTGNQVNDYVLRRYPLSKLGGMI